MGVNKVRTDLDFETNEIIQNGERVNAQVSNRPLKALKDEINFIDGIVKAQEGSEFLDSPLAWNSVSDYKKGEVVSYLGNNYTAIKDDIPNLNKIPASETTYWKYSRTLDDRFVHAYEGDSLTGNYDITGDLDVTGTTTLTGNVNIGDSNSDTLTIDSNSQFTDNVDIDGNLTVDGTTTLNGNIIFGDSGSDSITFNGDIAVKNDGQDADKFTIDNNTGNVWTAGTVDIFSTLDVGGNVNLGNATSDTVTISGTAGIRDLNVTTNIDTATLNTTGNVTLGNATSDTVTIAGTAGIRDLNVTTNIDTATLSTTGNVNLGNATSDTVTIAGTAGINNLDVTTNIDTATLSTTGNVSIGGNLTILGTTTTIDTQNLYVDDNKITLSHNETHEDSGIEINVSTTTTDNIVDLIKYRAATTDVTIPHNLEITQGAEDSRISLKSSAGQWQYLRLENSTDSTEWDIATKSSELSGALQFRPEGADLNKMYLTKDGDLVVQGTITSDGINSGEQLHITDTTDSTSVDTGALEVDGGVGVAKNLYVGGNVTLGNATSDTVTIAGTAGIRDLNVTTNIDTATLSTTGNVSIGGNLTLDNGTNTTVTIKADDSGLALLTLYGDSQGTGAVEVGQSSAYGGGISYNGDGTPSFVSGETSDKITFYAKNNNVRTEVFSYAHTSTGAVEFNGTVTAPIFSGSLSGNASNSTVANNAYGLLASTDKNHHLGESTNWDNIGFSNATNLHMQGHNQFWIGAGNGTWFTGSPNNKSQASGLSSDATNAHDLLLTTMQASSTQARGITFAVDSTGSGTSGWRLGKWHSGDARDSSKLVVDGGLFVKGSYTDEYDFYADDYSTYYSSTAGQAFWSGDVNAGWNNPSGTFSSAIQVQSGNNGNNIRNPQIQFHQYGYGGPAIEYDGPNNKMIIGDLGSSTAGRLSSVSFRRNNTDTVTIDLANSNVTATTFTGNATTATWADTVDVNSGNTSSTWYDVVWHSGDTVYSSTGVEIQGSTNSLRATNLYTTDLYVDDQILSTGDTNTYMQFHAADQWRVVTGGNERLEVNNSGITVNGQILATNYGDGLVGKYSATVFQNVFSMGESYKQDSNGSTLGTLYGISWTHSNNTNANARKISGHHAVFAMNGITHAAVGEGGVWAEGEISTDKGLNLGSTKEATIKYNSTDNSIDFIIN